MKKLTLLFLNLCLCNIMMAQYVEKKTGQTWGANENKYATLGEKAVSYIQNDMYVLAIECLNQMININCKNADRLKDYYSLAYCYFVTDENDKVIETCNKYISISPKSNPELNVIYFFQGFAYSMKGESNNAIPCLEKSISLSDSIDYHNLMQCHYLIARCYWSLDNNYLAKSNYKKAIFYGCKEEKVTIKQIETSGCNNVLLGDVFYYYSMLKLGESYNDWTYLIYLSAKCGHPQGLEQANKGMLFQRSSLPTPSIDLFQ